MNFTRLLNNEKNSSDYILTSSMAQNMYFVNTKVDDLSDIQ